MLVRAAKKGPPPPRLAAHSLATRRSHYLGQVTRDDGRLVDVATGSFYRLTINPA